MQLVGFFAEVFWNLHLKCLGTDAAAQGAQSAWVGEKAGWGWVVGPATVI